MGEHEYILRGDELKNINIARREQAAQREQTMIDYAQKIGENPAYIYKHHGLQVRSGDLTYAHFYSEVIEKCPPGTVLDGGIQIDGWPKYEDAAEDYHLQYYEAWKNTKTALRMAAATGERWLTFADFIPFVGCAARSINAVVKAVQHDPGAAEEGMNAGLDCATDIIPFGKIIGAGARGVSKIGSLALRKGVGAAAHATVEGARGLTLQGVTEEGKNLLADPFRRVIKNPVEALVVGTAEQIAFAEAVKTAAAAAALVQNAASGKPSGDPETTPTVGPEDRKQPTYQPGVTAQPTKNLADKFVALPPGETVPEKQEQQTQSASSTSTSLPVYIGVVILGGLAVSAIF
jgi:hypothetical protein